ncbi:MAG: hypothetical protein V2A70_05655 [Candidatus Omnitrophota bacterium]
MKSGFKLAVFLFFTVMTSMAYAHPASELLLSMDSKTKMLSVGIKHQVGDPARHYIDQVNTTINGKMSIGHSLTKQDAASGETLSYYLPDVKEGDVIAVDTHCNKGGNLKKEIVAQLQ